MSNETQLSAAEKALLRQGNEIVRQNMIADVNYRLYCSFDLCRPRTRWNDGWGQMECPCCGKHTEFPDDFIALYRRVHGLAIDATTINQ